MTWRRKNALNLESSHFMEIGRYHGGAVATDPVAYVMSLPWPSYLPKCLLMSSFFARALSIAPAHALFVHFSISPSFSLSSQLSIFISAFHCFNTFFEHLFFHFPLAQKLLVVLLFVGRWVRETTTKIYKSGFQRQRLQKVVVQRLWCGRIATQPQNVSH